MISLWLNVSDRYYKPLKETKNWGSLIFGIILITELTIVSFKTTSTSTSKSAGTYQVNYSTDISLPASALIHIHSKGYMIVQMQDKFQSQEINLNNHHFNYHNSDTSSYTGNIKYERLSLVNHRDTIVATRRKKEFCLMHDKTHWTVESYSD
jgi:major membrane immunogen (membrane-anchored lipoprotein)